MTTCVIEPAPLVERRQKQAETAQKPDLATSVLTLMQTGIQQKDIAAKLGEPEYRVSRIVARLRGAGKLPPKPQKARLQDLQAEAGLATA